MPEGAYMKIGKSVAIIVLLIAMIGIMVVPVIYKSKERDLKDGNEVQEEAEEVLYTTESDRVIGEFTAKTTSQLLIKTGQNTCYSPISLFAALTLTTENAAGKTREELLEGVAVESIDKLESLYDELLGDIEENGEDCYSYLKFVNSMWINSTKVSDYSDSVVERSKSKLASDVFFRDIIKSEDINKWFEEETNGIIKDVVEGNDEYYFTLLNALHYKSKWSTTFKVEKDKEFVLENNDVIKTEYISAKYKDLCYKELNDIMVASVPLYEGEMILALPDKDIELKKIMSEQKLDEILRTVMSDNMDTAVGQVCFPTFECKGSYSEEFIALIEGMGITHLYKNNQWEVSEELNSSQVEIMQNTSIRVDSHGVEAAASTGVLVTRAMSANVNPMIDITFDRPFLYILMKDNVPLFVGTVYNPAE